MSDAYRTANPEPSQLHPDVVKLKALAQSFHANRAEYSALARRMAEDSKRSATLQETLQTQRRQILEQLQHLDCHSQGNHGWENRYVILLGELCSQSPAPASPSNATPALVGKPTTEAQ